MAKKLTGSNLQPTHEEIAQQAQLLYEQSGRVSGRDIDNWLKAEAQLLAARQAAAERSTAAKGSSKAARQA